MRIPEEAISFDEQIQVKINKVSKPIQLIKNRDFYWTLIKTCQKKNSSPRQIIEGAK